MIHLDSTDGVRIALHDMGGDGPPLLLTHATGFAARVYEPLAAVLATEYHVWGVDVRAHGHATSPVDPAGFGWDHIATDVVTAAEHLGLEGAVSFGHSMGAAVALIGQRLRPSTFRAMYCYEPVLFPAGFAHEGGVNPLAPGARRRKEVFADRGEVMTRLASRPPFSAVRADMLLAYANHGFEELDDRTVRVRCRAEDEASTYEGEILDFDFDFDSDSDSDVTVQCTIESMAAVSVPVTVAGGGRGLDPGPSRLAPAIAQVMAHGRYLKYDDLSHFGPMEAPDRIASDALAAFRQPR